MKTIRPLHIIVLVLLLNLTSAAYAGKYALVIGNGAYKGDASLPTPVNDADEMASTLQSLGFSVKKGTDLVQQEMEKAIHDFGSRLSTGDIALFYFSGHGSEVDGINYLIPIGISTGMIKYRAVPLDIVLDKMKEAGSRVNIVILDACRNNPFKGAKGSGKGLASVTGGKGTFIAYATAPGSVAGVGSGSTSIYTKYLVNAIKTPGLKIEDVFKKVRESVLSETSDQQNPWESSSLTGKDFYFADSGSTTIVTPTKESKLNVIADVSGAEVWINGNKQGVLPKTFTLSESGTYQIKVTASGYKLYQATKKIEIGKEYDVSVHLEKERDESETVRVVTPPGDKTITNSLGMKFVKIPAGSFTMGSPSSEPDRDSDETQHRVTISNSFYMQTTEVTQGQWKAVMGSNPSKFSDCGNECPVEMVSWDDVQEFIKSLNRKGEGTYRLPTEAEWEYAARAGTTTPFSFGSCLSTDQANYNGNYPLEGCSKGTYRQKPVSVGSFSPNAYGLYDMHGNVWEWCADWKGDYPSGSVTDPTGPSSGSPRVIRGGSWSNIAQYCRSADRLSVTPGPRNYILGFRLCFSP